MQPIILTTTVHNPDTLPLLLKLTDELNKEGLLTELRVVDKTIDKKGTIALREQLPMDGESRTKSIVVDYGLVKKNDDKAYISTGLTGYHYTTSGHKLVRGGSNVTIACRTTLGASAWISKQRSGPGLELVLGKSSCFFRKGKGGGARLSEIEVSGVVDDGTGWRSVEVSWKEDGRLIATLDNGDVLTENVPVVSDELEVHISSAASGTADVVITSLKSSELGLSNSRDYAYYYADVPDRVMDAVEVFSKNDIVFIDKVGWSSLVSDEDSIPFVVGDPSYINVLKRAGVLKESLDVHKSFLDRSRRCIDRVRDISSKRISVNADVKNPIVVRAGIGSSFGRPSLICVLDQKFINDKDVIERYRSLSLDGPVGEILSQEAEDIIVYLDSILLDDSKKVDSFLVELIECIGEDHRASLLKLLSR